jgi:hypothetical protein
MDHHTTVAGEEIVTRNILGIPLNWAALLISVTMFTSIEIFLISSFPSIRFYLDSLRDLRGKTSQPSKAQRNRKGPRVGGTTLVLNNVIHMKLFHRVQSTFSLVSSRSRVVGACTNWDAVEMVNRITLALYFLLLAYHPKWNRLMKIFMCASWECSEGKLGRTRWR